MGIPSFYRWVLDRYPRCVEAAVEETPTVVNGVTVPIDITAPNPNGYEFDNLYLDMNGIVHPCFHPEGLPPPETYNAVFMAVFKYIDKIVSIIRPRKLLFMAIDGVAPRAKMNQQRARRFRAAKDAADAASGIENMNGSNGEKLDARRLDSNVITPGTEFMAMLSSALQYYVRLRMNEDPGWQGIKVILSDASVPGEGEHKIVSYIRLQRNLPGFDPNTRHCLYGLDADLIMLALATHEVHFTLVREDVRKAESNNRHLKHVKPFQGSQFGKALEKFISEQKFQLFRIWVLRDYLAHDLQIHDSAFKIDLERVIDDFVFMCLFVGNDFLPHMPSLEISEGAIDLLINVYKKEFVQMGGYLTNSAEVNLKRVEHFIQAVGSYENIIFRKRIQEKRKWGRPMKHRSTNSDPKWNQNKSPANYKAIVEHDEIKLGEEGWKERYYAEKFGVETVEDCEILRRNTALKYAEGICWVMHYYYQGVCSWQWFYPYHYAPFASDFHGFDKLDTTFTLGKPFKPLDQLMGVLPAASAQALPLSYRKLMTDPLSPILDFYPPDFELDINGKRHSWQAVCKLPFIEECRLLSEISKLENTLTNEEKKRNILGLDMLFVHRSYRLAGRILSFYHRNENNSKVMKTKVKRKINPNFSHGMNGYMYISDQPLCPKKIQSPINGMDLIRKNKVICVFYKVPAFHPHITRLPDGVILPDEAIREHDILPPPMLWHEITAITRQRHTRRPMPPKSISGSCLERLAHRLVVKNLVLKKQESGVPKAVQEGPLTTKTSHDNEIPDDACRKRKRSAVKRKKLKTKNKKNRIHEAVKAPLTIQTCSPNEILDVDHHPVSENVVKNQQEIEVHEAVPTSPLTNQTCPDSEILGDACKTMKCSTIERKEKRKTKKQKNGVHNAVPAPLRNQTCSDHEILDDDHRLVSKSLAVNKQHGNEVHKVGQATNQTCPDNEAPDDDLHLVLENFVVKNQRGIEVHETSPLTNQTCPVNEMLGEACRKMKCSTVERKEKRKTKKQKNGVHNAVPAPLRNQTCPVNEILDDDNRLVLENVVVNKQQDNEVHEAVRTPLTSQTCPDNEALDDGLRLVSENFVLKKQRENEAHEVVQAAPLTNQTCPDNETSDHDLRLVSENLVMKQREGEIHEAVQAAPLTNQTCPDNETSDHDLRLVSENLVMKQRESEIHEAVQAAPLTNQTCPDNETSDHDLRLVSENLVMKQQENEIHEAVQAAPLTNQIGPDNEIIDDDHHLVLDNVVEKQREVEVHEAVQASPLRNQICPDNEILVDACRKRKCSTVERKEKHKSKKQKNGAHNAVHAPLTNQTFSDSEILDNDNCLALENLVNKQQENEVHEAVETPLTNKACPNKDILDHYHGLVSGNLYAKQQSEIHEDVEAAPLTSQTCPGNEILNDDHSLVSENVAKNQRENEVHEAVHVAPLTNQTFPDNEIIDDVHHLVLDNVVKKQQENGVHETLLAAPLRNQACPENEILED